MKNLLASLAVWLALCASAFAQSGIPAGVGAPMVPNSVSSGGGGGGTPGGTSGQVQYNNAGSFGGFTVSGDGSLNTGTGVLTVTGTNGAPFGALATLIPATGIATFLTTPTSSNLAAAITDETGTGSAVFATSPTLVTPVLGAAGGTSLTLGGAALPSNGVFAAKYSPGANTATNGFVFSNTNAASTGNQQFACSSLIGQGWKTTATAASQPVEFQTCVEPVQGATAPTGSLIISSQVNGGGYVGQMILGSAGSLGLINSGPLTIGASTVNQQISAGTSGIIQASGSYVAWVNSSNIVGASIDTFLYRDNAGILAQRNGTAGQIQRTYASFTDASNGAWGAIDLTTNANTLTIGSYGNGTGASTLSKLRFDVLGVNKLDYGLTSAGLWSFSVPAVVTYSNNSFASGITVENTNAGTTALAGFSILNTSAAQVGQFVYYPSNYTNAILQNTVAIGSVTNEKVGFISGAGTGNPDIYFQTGALSTGQAIYIVGSATAPLVELPSISSDAGLTDANVCEDTTSHGLHSGSGTLGICLGTSSARYKHDITPLDDGLTTIMALNPKRYYLNADHGDPTKPYYGFIAEDCSKAIPELTGLDNLGKPNTCDYVGIIPILVNALKQQQAEIESLHQFR